MLSSILFMQKFTKFTNFKLAYNLKQHMHTQQDTDLITPVSTQPVVDLLQRSG